MLSALKENSFSTRSLWMWLSTDGFIIYFMCKHCTHARKNLHNVIKWKMWAQWCKKAKGKKTLTKQIEKRNDPVRHFFNLFFFWHTNFLLKVFQKRRLVIKHDSVKTASFQMKSLNSQPFLFRKELQLHFEELLLCSVICIHINGAF